MLNKCNFFSHFCWVHNKFLSCNWFHLDACPCADGRKCAEQLFSHNRSSSAGGPELLGGTALPASGDPRAARSTVAAGTGCVDPARRGRVPAGVAEHGLEDRADPRPSTAVRVVQFALRWTGCRPARSARSAGPGLSAVLVVAATPAAPATDAGTAIGLAIAPAESAADGHVATAAETAVGPVAAAETTATGSTTVGTEVTAAATDGSGASDVTVGSSGETAVRVRYGYRNSLRVKRRNPTWSLCVANINSL